VKILLVNDNPVVSKLVTLSAQKTSDQLDVVKSIDEIEIGVYDLLVLDDALFNEESLQGIKSKIDFHKSLYIHSRNAEHTDEFTATLKKPFLPTDLVELFSRFSRELKEESSKEKISEINLDDDFNLDMELEGMGDEEHLVLDDDLELDEDLALDEDFLLDDELVLDEDLHLNDESEKTNSDSSSKSDEAADIDEHEEFNNDLLEDELLIDEEAVLLEDDLLLEDEDSNSVLDKDELQEVQDLLDETEDELEEELSMDDNLEEELLAETNTDIPTQDDEDENIDEPEELSEDFLLEEELSMDDDLEEELLAETNTDIPTQDDEDENIDEPEELSEDFLLEEELSMDDDLETQIKNAVENLSDEDLNSELDAETLMSIAQSSIKDISGLNSRDLKLAIGEEVDDLPQEPEEMLEEESMEENFTEDVAEEIDTIEEKNESLSKDNTAVNSEENEGVEALKKLLKALTNEDVAASLKGMKISINITLGDK
jgi:uncharacterized membrane protein